MIQTAASPLGQLNGLHADLAAAVWELALSVYQALDPDQAEGVNLERVGKLRLLSRSPGETDADFRQAITNASRARIDMSDLSQALSALSGVIYAQTFVNETDTTDADGIPRQHVALAVLGGDDDEIAQTIRAYVVPGIGTYGNTTIETTIEGFCRSISIIRPAEIAVEIEVDVIARPDRNGCPPPSALAIAAGLAEALTRTTRPRNGQDVTEYLIRQAIESRYPNIEVDEVRANIKPGTIGAVPVAIGFFEIMKVVAYAPVAWDALKRGMIDGASILAIGILSSWAAVAVARMVSVAGDGQPRRVAGLAMVGHAHRSLDDRRYVPPGCPRSGRRSHPHARMGADRAHGCRRRVRRRGADHLQPGLRSGPPTDPRRYSGSRAI